MGTVERIVYEQDGGSWAVIRLRLDDGSSATAVGNLAPVFEGERLEVDGGWVEDARFGRQFRADKATAVRPADAEAIERYLASGVVPGIGPEIAARIVERFGDRTLDVFDEAPDKLLAVRGIGRVRLKRIREVWASQAEERQTRMFLQGLGLGPFLSDKILRAWGDATEQRLRDNPYALAASDEIVGIGFRRADQIARQLPGWAADAAARARAGVAHVVAEQATHGHCFVPYERLVFLTGRLLEVPDDQAIRRAVGELLEEGRLVTEPLDDDEVAALSPRRSVEAESGSADQDGHRAVYDVSFRDAERRVARRLRKLLATPAESDKPGGLSAERAAKAAAWVENKLGIELGSDQRSALEVALSQKVLLVTGGPGTGKTTLIDAMVRCGLATGATIELAAPTGRAAKRLSEATGHASLTLHRLLEYRPRDGGFGRNSSHPLDGDVVIVDEASMIDLFLMDALVAAVPPRALLVLVGDADQLPPVGPGAVLRDLLASEVLPTARLREIYRQAQRSLIVRNAHRVNQGKLPEGLDGAEAWEDDGPADFYFIGEEDPDRARRIALTLVADRIPARFGFDPRRDIQVVAPMHRGKAGVTRLNHALQERLNAGQGGADARRLRPASGRPCNPAAQRLRSRGLQR